MTRGAQHEAQRRGDQGGQKRGATGLREAPRGLHGAARGLRRGLPGAAAKRARAVELLAAAQA
eukprot:11176481-Lingulodinium_polyedra.AAC.1